MCTAIFIDGFSRESLNVVGIILNNPEAIRTKGEVILMKKFIGILAVLFMFCLYGTTAMAADNDTVVALGADLTSEQRATVLNLMGLTESDLSECTVIYTTNEMEHEYLDSYLDPAVIGTKSLSSVKITKAQSGSGVIVTTQNINYCTTGMYRNALMTAGMEDTEVLVVAPTPISGTAGLIGALKAYEVMSSSQVSDMALDTALDELITTGELADSIQGDISSEDVEALMAWLKSKIASGELDTGDEDSVRDVIKEGESNFGITLSEKEIQDIISLLKKLDSLGLNAEYLLEQAQKLYDKYGLDLVENANDAINEAVGNAVTTAAKNFFQNLKDSISNFFKNLF